MQLDQYIQDILTPTKAEADVTHPLQSVTVAEIGPKPKLST